MEHVKNIFIIIYHQLSKFIHSLWAFLLPGLYAKYYYRIEYHSKLNLNAPKDYNEKIQWLKLYSDITSWTTLADKYLVREYVKECGLGDILVRLYGVWKKPDEIDFSLLPVKFVLKTNNGCGKNILVYDKNSLDIDNIRKLLKKWVRERNGLVSFQPHMWNIDRRIIAEELLEDSYNEALSSSIIDYKFFCFHGEPEVIDVLFDRPNKIVGRVNNKDLRRTERLYDLNWNLRPDLLSSPADDFFQRGIPKPTRLTEMITICRTLSKPFHQVRVDLYEVNGKVYFGELTFTPGEMGDFTKEYLLYLGSKIDLTKVARRKKIFLI